MPPRPFLTALVVAGLLLTITVIPGVFTIDEDNYVINVIALRQRRLTVPGTEGLPPSSELVWFDPQAYSRKVNQTPVASTAPPLYGPLALPFSLAGWRGLVAVNTLSFLVIAAGVFAYARRYSDSPAAWAAAVAFALGGYSLEYAQGVWPHLLAVALTTTAAVLAARSRDGDGVWCAVLAGLMAGLATGVRYQNVLIAASIGLGLFLLAPNRWRSSAAYGLGLLPPLTASAILNRLRLGSWNPISKGPGYFSVSGQQPGGDTAGETLVMLWARVVDYAQRPPLSGVSAIFLHPEPHTGAYVLNGVVKKAWLQSAPWLVLPLLAMLVVWWPRRTSNGDAPAAQRRELRALSLIIFAVLGVFALTGTTRTDGWSYNQRYFLELVPLAAVGFGWAVGRAASRRRELLVGAGLGSLLALVVLLRPPEAPVRHLALLYVPLALAALLALSWIADRSEGRRALALAAGVGLAWALVVHLGDDLRGSRSLRRSNQIRLQAIAPSVGTPAGIFTFWGNKDALGPLLLGNDIVVADCFADRGATAAELRTAFHERSRRVFVITPFPRDLFARLRGDRAAVVHSPLVVEILPTRAVPTRSGLDTAPASSRIGP